MNSPQVLRIKNVGFVATRIAGTDGVSLEIGKWAEIIEGAGFDCHYVCATSDRPEERTFLIPEADFFHPEVKEVYEHSFGRTTRSREISRHVDDLKQRIKSGLYLAVDHFKLDALIAENVLTIPMNLPFGLALTEFLFETGIPCITHYQRLLDYIRPDQVHVLVGGRIVASGGPELALELERDGYDRYLKAAA